MSAQATRDAVEAARSAFETWQRLIDPFARLDRYVPRNATAESYVDSYVEIRWIAWSAAWQAARRGSAVAWGVENGAGEVTFAACNREFLVEQVERQNYLILDVPSKPPYRVVPLYARPPGGDATLVKDVREALAFYADPKSWTMKAVGFRGEDGAVLYASDAEKDEGHKASALLPRLDNALATPGKVLNG